MDGPSRVLEPRHLQVGFILIIFGRQHALYRHIPGSPAVGTDPCRRAEVDDVISVSGLAYSSCGNLAVSVYVRQKFVAETLSRRMRKALIGSTFNYNALVALRYSRVWALIDRDIRWRRRQIARTSFYFRFRLRPIYHRAFAVASSVRCHFFIITTTRAIAGVNIRTQFRSSFHRRAQFVNFRCAAKTGSSFQPVRDTVAVVLTVDDEFLLNFRCYRKRFRFQRWRAVSWVTCKR